ncbi:hypothetical protein ACEWY4_011387 [Coilia grayii]|uniref:Uncharacterized protein n=1 Tax=Coilia grayii TaxID=363190 RepID=A0ABD1K4K7_9TELE
MSTSSLDLFASAYQPLNSRTKNCHSSVKSCMRDLGVLNQASMCRVQELRNHFNNLYCAFLLSHRNIGESQKNYLHSSAPKLNRKNILKFLDPERDISILKGTLKPGDIIHYVFDRHSTVNISEDLYRLLPTASPMKNQHHKRCAIVGNSGILLNSSCGPEIDSHDFVIRGEGAVGLSGRPIPEPDPPSVASACSPVERRRRGGQAGPCLSAWLIRGWWLGAGVCLTESVELGDLLGQSGEEIMPVPARSSTTNQPHAFFLLLFSPSYTPLAPRQ